MDGKNLLEKVRSKYILKIILNPLSRMKLINLSFYNKKLRKFNDIKVDEYKQESLKIIIEIFPLEKESGKFINIRKGNEPHFKIYFNNNNKKEINTQKITKKDYVYKIRVIIDPKTNAFYGLFNGCKIIKKIKFIRFNRTDIKNMNLMFYGCSSLKELDLSHFRTDKVNTMFRMFGYCSSLKKLNLFKFNTSKVKEMNSMFENCSFLEELNLSSFNTFNVEFYVFRMHIIKKIRSFQFYYKKC